MYGEEVELDFEVKDAEEMKTQEEFIKNLDKLEKIRDWEAAERRMEIIGQNGNDGEHYSELDLNKDGKIDQKEIKFALKRIKQIKNTKGGDLKPNSEIERELKSLKKLIDDSNDLTKTY